MTKAMSIDSRWKILTAEMDSAKSTIAVARKRLNVLQASGNEFYVSVLKALTLQAICRVTISLYWVNSSNYCFFLDGQRKVGLIPSKCNFNGDSLQTIKFIPGGYVRSSKILISFMVDAHDITQFVVITY